MSMTVSDRRHRWRPHFYKQTLYESYMLHKNQHSGAKYANAPNLPGT
jgi:hypothetical protein